MLFCLVHACLLWLSSFLRALFCWELAGLLAGAAFFLLVLLLSGWSSSLRSYGFLCWCRCLLALSSSLICWSYGFGCCSRFFAGQPFSGRFFAVAIMFSLVNLAKSTPCLQWMRRIHGDGRCSDPSP